jgi:hypothetical protein
MTALLILLVLCLHEFKHMALNDQVEGTRPLHSAPMIASEEHGCDPLRSNCCDKLSKQEPGVSNVGSLAQTTVRLKADRLNVRIAVVIAIGGLERAAYYAVTTPWRECVLCC